MAVQLNAYRKHMGGTRPLKYTPTIELDIVLDILDGCTMRCPGCFVTKKNKFFERDLLNVYNITQQFLDMGFEANELFLGPTDMFATSNFDQVMDDPMFEKLVQQYSALTFTSTMMSDPVEVSKTIDKLMSKLLPYDKHFELFVVVDIEKYVAKDRSYLDIFEANLKTIADLNGKLNKQINIFFIANFYENMFRNVSLPVLNEMLKKDYGTKFKINPSFARASNSRIVEKHSLMLRDILEKQVDDQAIQSVFLNMADIYFGGDTFHPLTYTDGRLFVAPFLYDFIPLKVKDFEVKPREDGSFHIDDIFALRQQLIVDQFNHAENLSECKSCEFLPNCVARNNIQFMKIHNIEKCIMPKRLFRASYKVVEDEL